VKREGELARLFALRLLRRRSPVLATFEGLGRALAEAPAVRDREPAHMREPQAHGNLGDACLGISLQQPLAHLPQAGIAQVAYRRDALEIPEVHKERPSGNAGHVDEIGDRDSLVEMGFDVVDGAPHVARREWLPETSSSLWKTR
jgi:hypothetical protein